ncbi:hypothetical protein [Pseudoalteromonas sp. BSi20495]|uniref:hypothetical protein n=1 Tax=Pseudoalteromonas sp. BSi20495 TaxID=386429 RepID=UPI00023163AA|nr:hypothetical protein [Pseudoalteromonas sp. BSi20495]GAA81385.1 hypothetical protein P20495_3916 [Pseudoalteromonas sp. BSi20495]
MNNLSFRVIPTENGQWNIFSPTGGESENICIDYKALKAGQAVNLYYELVDCLGWEFAENGTYFSDAKDNFNYQLTSIVANSGQSLIVSISSIIPAHALPAQLATDLADNPDEAVSGMLSESADYEVNFRLVAKNTANQEPTMRYFSQDPRVILQDMEPH